MVDLRLLCDYLLSAREKSSVTIFVIPFFFFFLLFLATLEAYGGVQGGGQIRDVAAGLCHSHSNAGSKLHLQPTPHLMVTPDP